MTALGGVWTRSMRLSAPQACGRILNAQGLYGPHGSAKWAEADVALGRRLYALTPEDRFDSGVVETPQGWVGVADARLDNRAEVLEALGMSGAAGKRQSDAWLVLTAWSRWEDDSFDRLLGDYAFAAWSVRRQKMVLARDPFGRRPLFYHQEADFFAFASMPKGLHALQEIPPAPDLKRLHQFLSLAPETGPRSFFADIARVEPGEIVSVTQDGLEKRAHCQPRRRRVRFGRPQEYVDALSEQLDRSVAARLRGAETRVGAHLSAGWDSAAVTVTAARLRADNGAKVLAYTATPRPGFAGAAPQGRLGDEGPLAAQIAAGWPNVEHVILPSSGRSPLEDVDRDRYLSDRPLLNLCNHVWLNDIHRAAQARGVTVMLTGDLGNVAFSEMGRDRLPGLADLRPGRRRRNWFAARIASMNHLDLGPYYKGVLAGYGIDIRDPLSDRRLVDYCLGVPTWEVLRGGQRSLSRRLLHSRLPAAVLKTGLRGFQAADWYESLSLAQPEVSAEVERLATCAPAASLVDITDLRRLLATWPTGGWDREAVILRYRHQLLRAISAGSFVRRVLGQNQ